LPPLGLGTRESTEGSSMEKPVENRRRRRIIWVHVLTVMSAAILIGAEVFGAAFAGGWALAGLFRLGETGGFLPDRPRHHGELHSRRPQGRAVHGQLSARASALLGAKRPTRSHVAFGVDWRAIRSKPLAPHV